jgi:hypothetical protein
MNYLFSVFHKEFKLPKSSFVKPIIVGNSFNNFSPDIYLRDNSSENISDLNSYFCELTAMYWLWKNYDQKPFEIIGLAHYRRYLFTNHLPFVMKDRLLHMLGKPVEKKIFGWQNIKVAELDDYIVSETFAKSILKSFKIILPYPIKIDYPQNAKSVRESYELAHSETDLSILESIIRDKCLECVPAFYQTMEQNYLSICNMFITTREVYDDYCNWLFPILFELYEKIEPELKYRDDYQKRSIGFIAERLLNVYVNWKLEPTDIFYVKQAYIQ